MRSQVGVLGGFALVFGAALGLFAWTDRLPSPRGADTPIDRFAEARARPIVAELAALGPHPLGSARVDEAADLLLARLKTIDGVESELQIEQRLEPYYGAKFVGIGYELRNVVARLRGERDEAILIAAHYDSTPFGPGAGDDAVGVAVAIELLRALAAAPRQPYSIVLLLDGGEEADRLGAIAFAHHPWAKDVRAFANLESLGRGRAAILRSPADGGAILHAVARSMPRPFANPLGHDLAVYTSLRLIETDYSVFRDALKISGFDYAHTRGAERYHAPDDTIDHVESGSLQDMGDNLFAVITAWQRELPRAKLGAEWATYCSFLGRWLIVVELPTLRWAARGLGAIALGLLLWQLRRDRRRLAAWLLRTLAAIGASAIVAMGAAQSLSALGRTHAWIALPLLGAALFSTLALLGWQLVLGRAAARATIPDAPAVAVATLLPIAALAIAAAEKGMRVTLFLLALGGATTIVALAGARARSVAAVVGLLFALLAVEGLATLVWALGPMAATSFVPVDVPFAGGCVLVVAMAGALLAPALIGAVGAGRTSGLLLGGAALLAIVVVAPFPYGAARPIRATVLESSGRLRIAPSEPVDLGFAIGDARRVSPYGVYPFRFDITHEERSPLPPRPRRLTIDVESVRDDGAVRIARLRTGGMSAIRLRIHDRGLVGWSLGEPLVPLPAKYSQRWIVLDGKPSTRWTIELRYRSDQALPIELSGIEHGALAFDAIALRSIASPAVRYSPTALENRAIVLPPRPTTTEPK